MKNIIPSIYKQKGAEWFSFLCPVLLMLVILTACNHEKGDYKSPFYKMFKAETKKGDYILQMFRETAGDSLTTYSGYFVHPSDFDRQPMGFLGKTSKDGKFIEIRLTATEVVKAKISPDGNELNGWLSRFNESENKYLPDSIPFKATIQNPKISFNYLVGDGVETTFPGVENSSELIYKFCLLDPVNLNFKDSDTLVFNKIKSGFYKFYGLPDSTQNLLQSYVKDFADEHFKYERKNMKPEDFKDPRRQGIYDINRNIYVMNNSAGILTLKVSESSYGSGAAHSIYGENYLNYNLKTGRKIALSDVLNRQGYRMISKLITNKIKEINRLTPGQSLKDAGYFSNSVKYTDRFFLTDYGIGFHYNIYEIASFASGETTVFLTFKELEGCIQPEILALAELETIKK